MKYQDLKVRDAGRLLLIGIVLGAATVGTVLWANDLKPVVGRRYDAYPWGLGLGCLIVLGMAAYYLLTSPEQNAQYIARKAPEKLDPKLLDPTEPHFGTPTWRYWLSRRHPMSKVR